ncbi:unnamed protein product, partial [Ilex paraguariensis]
VTNAKSALPPPNLVNLVNIFIVSGYVDERQGSKVRETCVDLEKVREEFAATKEEVDARDKMLATQRAQIIELFKEGKSAKVEADKIKALHADVEKWMIKMAK